jgi:hypothetical protein
MIAGAPKWEPARTAAPDGFRNSWRRTSTSSSARTSGAAVATVRTIKGRRRRLKVTVLVFDARSLCQRVSNRPGGARYRARPRPYCSLATTQTAPARRRRPRRRRRPHQIARASREWPLIDYVGAGGNKNDAH